MNRLMNKRILLGVSGSIAAYKSAELVRLLMDVGAEVQVVMTAAAPGLYYTADATDAIATTCQDRTSGRRGRVDHGSY